jgi:hypothetical protein
VTEAEWLACDDPEKMLEFLRGKASDRKLRLFAVACCRRTWSLVEDDRKRMVANGRSGAEVEWARQQADLAWRAAEVAERYADGLTDLAELRALIAADDELEGNYADGSDAAWTARASAYVARWCAKYRSPQKFGLAARLLNPLVGPWFGVSSKIDHDREQSAQCHLLRDIFGPLPIRPVSDGPALLAWQGGTVPRLARTIYEERELPSGHLDCVRLAVLAHALEEAGCTSEDILAHLHGPGPHARGCWVLDLALEKE